MGTNSIFKAAVHRLRRARGLQLAEVAARAGYSPSYLSKLLNGQRPLVPATVREIDQALDAGGELVRLAAQQQKNGGVAARPMQLPPMNADFLGRDSQLLAMDWAVAEGAGTAVTVVIEGGFWTGKTELAIQWATRAQRHFPGGCLFVDLRGLAPGAPANPADVLTGFLAALGVSKNELSGSSVSELAARFRTLLAERPAIVVLDNIADYRQVEMLLPGGESVTVVTARESQATLLLCTGGKRLALEPLGVDDALELLGRRVGAARVAAEPTAAETLVRRCGRLPMPVLIAARLVAEREGETLATLAEKLASDRTRLDVFSSTDPAVNVHGVIDVSYLALEKSAARVFRLLGVGPTCIVGVDSTAALTGLPPDQARQALAELRRAHLLEPGSHGRYRMSSLLRAYAYERGIVEEHLRDVEHARDQLLRWYTATAWAANNSIIPRWAEGRGIPEDVVSGTAPASFADGGFEAAMEWCDAEVDTALEIARDARTFRAADIRWQLPTAFLPYFVLTRDWNRWLIAANDGLAAAYATGNDRGIARSLQALGWVEHQLGRPSRGVPLLEKALRMHTNLGDDCSRAWTGYGLGSAHAAAGDHLAARRCHQLADELFTAHHATVGIIVNRAKLAIVVDALGHTDEAMRLAQDTLTRAQQLASPVITSLAHHCLGILLNRNGHRRAGLAHLDEALALRTGGWQRWHRAETLIARAEALAGLSQRAQALDAYRSAAALLDELSDPRLLDVRARIAALDVEHKAV